MNTHMSLEEIRMSLCVAFRDLHKSVKGKARLSVGDQLEELETVTKALELAEELQELIAKVK